MGVGGWRGACGGRYHAFVLTVKDESEILEVDFSSVNAGVQHMCSGNHLLLSTKFNISYFTSVKFNDLIFIFLPKFKSCK